jgi:hypothetical protein
MKIITREIAEEFIKKTSEVGGPAFGYEFKSTIDLSEFSSIADDAAPVLAKYKGRELILDGVQTLSLEAAASIAKFKGLLSLNGLVELDTGVAICLAKHSYPKRKWGRHYEPGEVDLILNGVTEISSNVAKALLQHKGRRLHIKGLKKISAEVAELFAEAEISIKFSLREVCADVIKTFANHNYKHIIDLEPVKTIDAETAKELAGLKQAIYLGILELPYAVAEALSSYKGSPHSLLRYIYLPNLKSISPESAQALAKVNTELNIRSLERLDSAAAKELLKHKKLNLILDNLIELDAETARELCASYKTNYGLDLNGLKHLSRETAVELRSLNTNLFISLKGLSEISDEVAYELSQRNGVLDLSTLTNLSQKALNLLKNNKHVRFHKPED